MKYLLITNYWSPYNSSGTLRWLQFGRYMYFDVLTSKKPRKGFYDDTLPKPFTRRIYRYGSNLPAVFSGIYLTLRGLFIRHYSVYIITIPPFSLSFCAWLYQKMGRKVILDVRDNAQNINNYWKLTTKICEYFQKQVTNRTTVFQFIDTGAKRILNGYNPELTKKTDRWSFIKTKLRYGYRFYNYLLSSGNIPDYRKKVKGRYGVSRFVNLKYLGYEGLPVDDMHPECMGQPVQSWKESAKQMQKLLEE